MAHIIALGGLAESVSHIPLGHALIARVEVDAPVLLDQATQEFLDQLRAESIATVALIKGKEINIHTAA
jgi:hypothetical protein